MSPTLTPVFVVSFLLYYHLISKPVSRIWFPLPLVFSYQSILHATIEINILKHFHHVTLQLKNLQWFSTVQEIKIQTLQSRLRPSEPDLPSHFIYHIIWYELERPNFIFIQYTLWFPTSKCFTTHIILCSACLPSFCYPSFKAYSPLPRYDFT